MLEKKISFDILSQKWKLISCLLDNVNTHLLFEYSCEVRLPNLGIPDFCKEKSRIVFSVA
jgi:hypothetical protein